MNSERVYLYKKVRLPLEQFILSFVSEMVNIRVRSFSAPNNEIVYEGKAAAILRWEIPENIRHLNVLDIEAIRVDASDSPLDFDEAILIQVE